jgi:predicted nucleotide-binding protein
VLEEEVAERGFFARYAGDPVIKVPVEADHTWVVQDPFRLFLHRWKEILGRRRDFFLAYSSKLEATADRIRTILNRAGATVLDWQQDFVAGKTILEQIAEAAGRTTAGIFLFTRDDVIKGHREKAAPRDNVIFEAGFFAHAKGHERVLIIKEEGAKMPADLGGVVYEALADRSDTSRLEERILRFIETSL